jgi:hypothetical protein
MPLFRYYCLYKDGKIAAGEHVEADDLTVTHHAYEAGRQHPHRLCHVEV